MRLLDRILSDGFTTDRTNFPPEMEQWMKSSLESAQLVVVDNVAAYHFQHLLDNTQPKDNWIQASDFPNVMLPFESTFLEMRVRNHPGLQKLSEECGVLATMTNQMKVGVSQLGRSLEKTKQVLLQKDARYILTLFFFEYGRMLGKKPVWSASFMLPVNADGQIVETEGKFPLTISVYLSPSTQLPQGFKNLQEVEEKLANHILISYLYPCFLALSFMHCRNVSTLTEQPPPKLSKIHERRSGRPLLRYHVLQIDHMKQVLEKEGRASSLGLKQALHICRGHFKHYGRDGKGLLFGKYAATVWAPMHARGSAEHGIVVKDYDVR